MFKDISIPGTVWMGFNDLKHLSVGALHHKEVGATLASTGSHETDTGSLKSDAWTYEAEYL